ncbi:hypothetical protein BVY04_05420 [bacterium M21]|nr:hypothetical protein BVY04_05420 [bacterium M21]
MTPGKGFRVLVVDDYESIHDDFRRVLMPEENKHTNKLKELEGNLLGVIGSSKVSLPEYRLDFASQGEQAIEFVEQACTSRDPYALAFVDMRMPPGINGIETIQKLWAVAPGTEIVICTAYSDHSWEEMRSELPNHDRFLVLKKPFDTIEVSQMAAALTEKWHLARQVEEQVDELEAQKEHLAVTVMSIGDGVIVADNTGRLTMMNPAAEKLTGWEQDQAIGQPVSRIYQVLNETTHEICDGLVEQVLARQLPFLRVSGHAKAVRRDGSEVWVADNAAPIRGKQGDVIGVVLVIRDVTQKRRVEEEQAKLQKLESIGILAGGIAHDFNNLLTVMRGHLELAHRQVDGNSKLHHHLKRTEGACISAGGLTKQLLTFSKGGNPVRQTACVDDCVRDTADFVLHGANVKCTFDLSKDLWPARVDTGQISQVIQNLLINSRQAMPAGGTIAVTMRNVPELEAKTMELESGTFIEIAIKDEGIGMDEESQNRIFEPYYTTKKTGSGLGMAVCHSIITKHGGSIKVASILGKGTTFTIHLPALPEETVVRRSAVDDLDLPINAHILLMDDKLEVLQVTQVMLEGLGCSVECADDGGVAIEAFNAASKAGDPHDLLLVDLTVPGGIGGLEVLNKIKECSPETPVIVTSGYSDDVIMAKYEEYGFSARVEKPFMISELARAICQCLENRNESTGSLTGSTM